MLVEVKDVVVEDTVVVVVCTPRERKKGRMRQEVVILAARRSKALTLAYRTVLKYLPRHQKTVVRLRWGFGVRGIKYNTHLPR